MTKQEFMSMSLPYGLKFAHLHSGLFNCIADIKSDLVNGYCRFVPLNKGRKIIRLTSLKDYKPILHPLTDLTKEIEHNGEKFVPNYKIIGNSYFDCNWIISAVAKGTHGIEFIYDLPYFVVKKLIEWHFDIAGLIEKGEAIDVNTLETNPYK